MNSIEKVKYISNWIKAYVDKMPSKAQVMKMCKDGKTKKEICDMYPDCDQEKLKDMVDSCMNEMSNY